MGKSSNSNSARFQNCRESGREVSRLNDKFPNFRSYRRDGRGHDDPLSDIFDPLTQAEIIKQEGIIEGNATIIMRLVV